MRTPRVAAAAIVLSAAIVVGFAMARLVDPAADPPGASGFGIRYVQHPLVAAAHIVPGVIFLLLAPVQFIARVRQRRIRLHRRLGWLLVGCAIVSGLLALVVDAVFPAYGGTATQSAALVFGALFLLAVIKAVVHIRRREVRQHREWMIRAVALAAGVATIRVIVGAGSVLLGYPFAAVFSAAFWVGFGVNVLVAEVWIRGTEAPSAVSSQRARRVNLS